MIQIGDNRLHLHCADVLDWAQEYLQRIEQGEARPLSAIFNDAPYGLSDPPPMDKLLKAWLADDNFDGFSSGFMQKVWDCIPGPTIWRALLKICHPGAWCFTFTSSRTQYLLGVSLALAGWEVRDSIVWLRGSGLALGANIGKAIDREAGAEREVVGRNEHYSPGRKPGKRWREMEGRTDTPPSCEKLLTAPATPLAQQFDGYHTSLKGLHEVIVMAQAPRQGHTFARLASKWGVGGLNVESSRVGSETITVNQHGGYNSFSLVESTKGKWKGNKKQVAGRFPPNAIFSHVAPTPCPTCHTSGALSTKSLGLQGDGVPDEVECLTCKGAGWVGGCKRVGVRKVKASVGIRGASTRIYGGGKGFTKATGEQVGYADPDGNETVDDFECVEGCMIKLLGEQSGELLVGGTAKQGKLIISSGSSIYSGFKTGYKAQSYNDKGTAARFFPNFTHDLNLAPFFYCAKMGASRHAGLVENLPRTQDPRKRHHQDLDGSWLKRAVSRNPCRKPLDLIIWLAKMLKPPDEFGPVLAVPFAGEFSEVIGAALAGWKHIEIVEREPAYFYRGKAALEWWLEWQHNTQSSDPAAIRRLATKAPTPQPNADGEVQLDLFNKLDSTK